MKKFGDEQQFGAKDDGGNNNTYAVVYLKNYTWPGAVTIANVRFTLKLAKRVGMLLFWLRFQGDTSPIFPNKK